MPDLIQLMQQRGRSLLWSLLVFWGLAGSMLFLLPQQYKSETTSVAANLMATDPGRLFDRQVQHLYAPLGSSDQLDLLVGTGRLDTLYRPIARRFDLVRHYSISGTGELAIQKATRQLKKDSEVYKSDHGELKLRVWDRDPRMAADLANSLTGRLDSMHRELISRQNRDTRSALEKELIRLLSAADTLSDPEAIRQRSLYRGLIAELSVLLEQAPPAIYVMDAATVSLTPDKPDRVMILIAITLLTICCWLVVSLWSERRKSYEIATGA